MLGQCTEKHLVTLRRRYGEKRLCEAAARREHLNYQRIHIGDTPGSGRVKYLLAQMHQTYYFGFSHSACILAGTVLEQALFHRLGVWMDRKGPLAYSRSGERKWLQNRHDLLELELVDMLELARSEGIIREGRTLLLAHEIRWIRNMVVHEKIPVFQVRDDRLLELTVTKSRKGRVRFARIPLERAEVEGLLPRDDGGSGPKRPRSRAARGGCPEELTAYFCVSRTRMILRSLFGEIKTEGKTKDESGSSLLLWKES